MIQTTSKKLWEGRTGVAADLAICGLGIHRTAFPFCNAILDPLVSIAWKLPNGQFMLNLFRLVGILVSIPYLIHIVKKSRLADIARTVIGPWSDRSLFPGKPF